jgi:hypothetical protein
MPAIHNEVNAIYSDKSYVGYRQGYSVATKSISPEYDMNMMLEGKRYNLVMRIWNSEKMRNRGSGIESETDYGVALDPWEFYPELQGQPMYLEVEKSDGTQDILFLPADPSSADSIMANVDYPLVLIKPELTEDEWIQIKQERTDALFDWYDSTSVLRTWVCNGLEHQNRGTLGCGGQGGVPIPPLEPGGKWLRLVSFSFRNNESGEDELELFAASAGDVYPPNALSRFLIPGDGNYVVNRTLTALNPISNIRIRAIEDDCEPLQLKIGEGWIERSWRQVRDIITFAPSQNLTDNFLGARLNIIQVGLQIGQQFAQAAWDEVRRKHGEISTASGKDFFTFDFSDRTVKTTFEAMAHRGGCFNSDDGLFSNTISITIANIQESMNNGGGVAPTTGTSREVNFVFKLQDTYH